MYRLLLTLVAVLTTAAVISALLAELHNQLYMRRHATRYQYSRYMTRSPITYAEVSIGNNDAQLLVRNGEREVFDTVSTWADEGDIKEELIQDWMEKGLAFWSNPEGTRALHTAESKLTTRNERSWKSGDTLNKRLNRNYKKNFVSAELYFQREASNGDSIYVKAPESAPAMSNTLHELLRKPDEPVADNLLDDLVESGVGFTNIDQLFKSERIWGKANSIAGKLKAEFSIDSPEWQRWTNQTIKYNATSLTQVFGEYFREHSIGDVGGKHVQYVRKPGFVGTLAPGELFADRYPLESLPKRVLHPWPAMQEFAFHVRMPTTHPMVPSTILWTALGDRFTENFTQSVLQEDPATPIYGGQFMDATHAIRIAKHGKIGNACNPDEQIPHGGMVFDSELPYYTADHNATLPPDEVDPPVPDHLIPIVERWLDPLHDLRFKPAKLELEEAEEAEARSEELQRKRRMEAMLLKRPDRDQHEVSEKEEDEDDDGWLKPQWKVEEERSEQIIQEEVDAQLLSMQPGGKRASNKKVISDLAATSAGAGAADATATATANAAGKKKPDIFPSRSSSVFKKEKKHKDDNDDEDGDFGGEAKIMKSIGDSQTKLKYNMNLNLNDGVNGTYEEVTADEVRQDLLVQRCRIEDTVRKARELLDIMEGRKVRSKARLISYTIESVQDMLEEEKSDEDELLDGGKKKRRGKGRAKKLEPMEPENILDTEEENVGDLGALSYADDEDFEPLL